MMKSLNRAFLSVLRFNPCYPFSPLYSYWSSLAFNLLNNDADFKFMLIGHG